MLSEEELDVYFEIRSERLNGICGGIDDDAFPGKFEAMMEYCERQLDQIWRPEFVAMYKEGRLNEIMKEWDLYEQNSRQNNWVNHG